MTDVNSRPVADVSASGATRTAVDARAAPDARHVAMVELLFFAYRDFTAEADALLVGLGFGRAHHRVLHFVNRNPGLRVADLLEILKITKQSLARVLKQLVDRGHIRQTAGSRDRRERRLHVTDAGRALADQLLALQSRRLGAALEAAGPHAASAAEAFLYGVISPDGRADVHAIVQSRTAGGPQGRGSGP